MDNCVTIPEILEEIDRLERSEYVMAAKLEEQMRIRFEDVLRELKTYERRGIELEGMGFGYQYLKSLAEGE